MNMDIQDIALIILNIAWIVLIILMKRRVDKHVKVNKQLMEVYSARIHHLETMIEVFQFLNEKNKNTIKALQDDKHRLEKENEYIKRNALRLGRND